MKIDFPEVMKKSGEYKTAMTRFLRDMIAIPSTSGKEGGVINRIKEEMERVGFERIEIDPMGNIFGYIGTGKHLIAMDAHIDTVGIGDADSWDYDPYQGDESEQLIMGLGASDQKGGMASMVYAAKIIKELKLDGDYQLVVVGSVQEEDCDGLCWQYIIEQGNFRPELVVITEPSSCTICRGQRGRMEIRVTTSGVSCHGSAPERGENAIFKMAPILSELQALPPELKRDDFLGAGSLTVSEIFFTSPSRCAVADSCSISIDRRLTVGETKEDALQQIKSLPAVREAGAKVELYTYQKPSYTGLIYPTESYFPTWVLEEEHPICQAMIKSYRELFAAEPVVDKWTFSTNGVAIMGRYGIPCVGFGPGAEKEAHAPNEKTWKEDLVKCAALYSIFPSVYLAGYAGKHAQDRLK